MTSSEKPTSPLADVAASQVERTASERDPQATPPVAGAADPQVLGTGVADLPLAGQDALHQAVRDGAAEARDKGDDQPE